MKYSGIFILLFATSIHVFKRSEGKGVIEINAGILKIRNYDAYNPDSVVIDLGKHLTIKESHSNTLCRLHTTFFCVCDQFQRMMKIIPETMPVRFAYYQYHQEILHEQAFKFLLSLFSRIFFSTEYKKNLLVITENMQETRLICLLSPFLIIMKRYSMHG